MKTKTKLAVLKWMTKKTIRVQITSKILYTKKGMKNRNEFYKTLNHIHSRDLKPSRIKLGL